MSKDSDVLRGTLDLLILQTLVLAPNHGWAIAQRIQQVSNDLLRVQQGSLYPALHRLEHQGWIRSAWGSSEQGSPITPGASVASAPAPTSPFTTP